MSDFEATSPFLSSERRIREIAVPVSVTTRTHTGQGGVGGGDGADNFVVNFSLLPSLERDRR